MKEEKRILINSAEISARVELLARDIFDHYSLRGIGEITALWVEEGAAKFAKELFEKISKKSSNENAKSLTVRKFSIKAASYGEHTISSSEVTIDGNFDFSLLKGRKVLLIDDILETGKTARKLCDMILSAGADEVKTCFLLVKNFSDSKKIEILKNRDAPDFCGFEIFDNFVFGYGLDIRGKYRELPDIWEAL